MYEVTNCSDENVSSTARVPRGRRRRHCDRVMIHRRIRCELDPVHIHLARLSGCRHDSFEIRIGLILLCCGELSVQSHKNNILQKKKRKVPFNIKHMFVIHIMWAIRYSWTVCRII